MILGSDSNTAAGVQAALTLVWGIPTHAARLPGEVGALAISTTAEWREFCPERMRYNDACNSDVEEDVKIGVLAYRYNYYTNQRIIIDKVPSFTYVPVRDIYSYRRALALRINRLIGKPLISTFNLNNQFDDFDLNKVDVFHFSNGISYGKTPWVASFETILPRFDHLVTRHQGNRAPDVLFNDLTRRALDAIIGKACGRLIAWSQSAARIQKDLLSALPAAYTQPILDKMIVLHPPQKVLCEIREPRDVSSANPLRFIMVGAAFFRKGGREVFRAFQKLAEEEQLPIKLILVSSLRFEPYASAETEEDLHWVQSVIAAHPAWLEYYPELPNAQVVELQKNADAALLPSWAETYGLSIIEAQACGCPVITTDIRAFPEINNENIGWLIQVPKNNLGEALYTTAEERAVLSRQIQAGLEDTIRAIMADPAIVSIKGNAAVARVRAEHDPQRYGETLRTIYEQAAG